jgi:hypothetical protein
VVQGSGLRYEIDGSFFPQIIPDSRRSLEEMRERAVVRVDRDQRNEKGETCLWRVE